MLLLVLSLMATGCLLAPGSEAYQYSTSFINQVTTYPNIVTAKSRCMPGRSGGGTGISSQNVLVCDPYELLSADQLAALNRQLLGMQSTINSDRGKCDRNYPRPTIAIALVDSMRFGRTEEQSDENVINYAAIFSYYLFESWRLPTVCESESDKVIIFYSKADGVLYMYAGDNLREKLPRDVIRRTAVEAKAAFSAGIYEGMKYLLKRIQEILTTNRSGMFGTR